MILSTLNQNLFNRTADLDPPVQVLKDLEKSKRISGRSVSLGHSAHRACLRIKTNLFSSTSNTSIVSALSGQAFQDFQVESSVGGIVLKDSSRVKRVTPLAAVIQSRDKFTIYSSRPNYWGQERVNLIHNQKVYPKVHTHATVERVGKVVQVVLEGNSEPTYTIHKVQNETNRDFFIKYIIKKHDKLEASSRYGSEGSYTLEFNAGADPIMMILLAAIADRVSGQQKSSGRRRFSS